MVRGTPSNYNIVQIHINRTCVNEPFTQCQTCHGPLGP